MHQPISTFALFGSSSYPATRVAISPVEAETVERAAAVMETESSPVRRKRENEQYITKAVNALYGTRSTTVKVANFMDVYDTPNQPVQSATSIMTSPRLPDATAATNLPISDADTQDAEPPAAREGYTAGVGFKADRSSETKSAEQHQAEVTEIPSTRLVEIAGKERKNKETAEDIVFDDLEAQVHAMFDEDDANVSKPAQSLTDCVERMASRAVAGEDSTTDTRIASQAKLRGISDLPDALPKNERNPEKNTKIEKHANWKPTSNQLPSTENLYSEFIARHVKIRKLQEKIERLRVQLPSDEDLREDATEALVKKTKATLEQLRSNQPLSHSATTELQEKMEQLLLDGKANMVAEVSEARLKDLRTKVPSRRVKIQKLQEELKRLLFLQKTVTGELIVAVGARKASDFIAALTMRDTELASESKHNAGKGEHPPSEVYDPKTYRRLMEHRNHILETDWSSEAAKVFGQMWIRQLGGAMSLKGMSVLPPLSDVLQAMAAVRFRGDKLVTRKKVFETVELLENVLSFLPAGNILQAQATSKAFRDCYQASKMLQIKTFQQVNWRVTAVPTMVLLPRPMVSYDWNFNPLLLKETPNVYQTGLSVVLKDIRGVACWSAHCYPSGVYILIAFEQKADLRKQYQGSWQSLHVTDPAMPFKLSLVHTDEAFPSKQGEIRFDRVVEANIQVESCTVGQLIGLAAKIERYIRRHVKWVGPGDRKVYRDEADLTERMPEYKQLMKGKLQYKSETTSTRKFLD